MLFIVSSLSFRENNRYNSAFPAPIPPIGNKKKRKNNLKIRKTNSGDDTSKPKFFDDLPSPATLSTIPPKKKYKYMNQKL